MKKFVVFAIIIFTFLGVKLAKPYRISGDCMEPAIKDGKFYFLNQISHYLRSYKSGDIVGFVHEDKEWISRIVALEGDTIQIVEENVVVNGVVLRDKIHRLWTGWKKGDFAIEAPMVVPEGCVFVLSDNLSAQHDDSRVFGPISTHSLLGLIW